MNTPEPTTPRGTYQRSSSSSATTNEPGPDATIGDITPQNLPSFTAVVKRLLPSDVKIYNVDLDSNVLEARWILSPESTDHVNSNALHHRVGLLKYPWRIEKVEAFRFFVPGRPPFTNDTLVVVRDRLAPKPRGEWATVGLVCGRGMGILFTLFCLFVVCLARFGAK